MSVSPGLMRPCFSASRIMRFAILSLTEPPALKNSHLAKSSQSRCAASLLIRTKGVTPVWSRIESIILGRCQPGGGANDSVLFLGMSIEVFA